MTPLNCRCPAIPITMRGWSWVAFPLTAVAIALFASCSPKLDKDADELARLAREIEEQSRRANEIQTEINRIRDQIYKTEADRFKNRDSPQSSDAAKHAQQLKDEMNAIVADNAKLQESIDRIKKAIEP